MKAERAGSRLLLLLILAGLLVAVPVRAQIEANLSSYTGPNAKGYLNPIKEAFGAALNTGTFRSAHIDQKGFHFDFEIKTMMVKFGDSDKTFMAQTGEGFSPATQIEAPTVIGNTQSVQVQGQAGSQETLPGGFNLNSVALATPQITIGNVAGTQAVIRFITIDTGDTDIGKVSLWGLGFRHSISQYFKLPVDLAGGAFFQQFKLGTDLIKANAFSLGVQGSRRFSVLEPYAGLSYDVFAMKVKYEQKETKPPTKLDVDFGSNSNLHLAAGLGVNLSVVHLQGEVNISSQTSFVLGLSVGN